MDESLLTSLCTICHIDPPIYTCPRCHTQTCSLNCSKRHKIWSSCNGVRDPTIYKPISEVATPSGIDHDYNFIHSIEHGISRSEKVLIEDLGLVTREELKRARMGEDEKFARKRQKQTGEFPGEFCINNAIKQSNIQVLRAPRGMRRNQENTTTWNRKRKTIDWQVEWLFVGSMGKRRLLHKVSGIRPIGDQYDMICEEERRMNMTPEKRRETKREKAREMRNNAVKGSKIYLELSCLSSSTLLQDPESRTWCLKPDSGPFVGSSQHSMVTPVLRTHDLYIHRPLTPASFPKVLSLLDPEKSLTENLTNRCILEYPTIYVLDKHLSSLPNRFMLEQEFLKRMNNIDSKQNIAQIGVTENDQKNSSLSSSTEDSSDSNSVNKTSCRIISGEDSISFKDKD